MWAADEWVDGGSEGDGESSGGAVNAGASRGGREGMSFHRCSPALTRQAVRYCFVMAACDAVDRVSIEAAKGNRRTAEESIRTTEQERVTTSALGASIL